MTHRTTAIVIEEGFRVRSADNHLSVSYNMASALAQTVSRVPTNVDRISSN